MSRDEIRGRGGGRDLGGRGGTRRPAPPLLFALGALVQADSTTSKAVYPAYTPAEKVCAGFDLDLTEVLRECMRRIAVDGAIPFALGGAVRMSGEFVHG